MRGDQIGREASAAWSDGMLWRHSGDIDAPDDEMARLLDLAAFADGCLDEDERERVAERLTRDPIAASDVAAARALAPMVDRPEAVATAILERAVGLVGEPRRGEIIAFPPRQRAAPTLGGWAQWGSLVAAMAFASWLGFTLGVDTSRTLARTGQANEDGFLRELLDPSAGFMRDLSDGPLT